jgi:alpha,alpha-trehalose phosphorylase
MALIHGFAGLRDPEGQLSFRPYLPAGWTQMRFRLGKREQRLEVEVRPEETTYRLLEGQRLELVHCGQALRVEREAPVVVANS